jgi:hypothetical protein
MRYCTARAARDQLNSFNARPIQAQTIGANPMTERRSKILDIGADRVWRVILNVKRQEESYNASFLRGKH